MNLSQTLRLQQLQHRSAFEQPLRESVGFAERYDRESGKYVVSAGGDRLFTESLQIAALAMGQQVDLTGRRIDYL